MGHARNYLTVDILRRVLEGYFGYNIFFVMNVTGAACCACCPGARRGPRPARAICPRSPRRRG